MVQLLIDNSYSKVTGLSVKQEKELKELLSFSVGSYFGPFGIKRRSLLDKRGHFPTGLLSRVEAYLGKGGYARKNLRAQPISQLWPISASLPYAAQSSALIAAIDNHQGIISMPTGAGKSKVVEMISERLGVKTLVIVPSLEIKKQLSSTLKRLSNVTIENIDSKALNSLTGFDCLIIDEAHHVAARTYQKLNKTAWKGIYYRFMLTATPFRNQDEETLLFEGIAGQVIYRQTYQEAVEAKSIVPIEGYYLDVPPSNLKGEPYPYAYKHGVVNNETRNLMISKLLLTIPKPTLCLVKEVLHGQTLSEMSGIPFVSGQDDESKDYIRQFNEGEITHLIGTQQVLGEGIDTRPAEFIIVASLTKAKSQLMQICGRGVRNYPGKESASIILFKDKSNSYLLKHYQAQCKVMKTEYGVIPLKLKEH